jgi:hypothetical protein
MPLLATRARKKAPIGAPHFRDKADTLNGVVNPAFQSRFWGCACFVGNDLPVFEQKQRWNTTHTEGRSGGGVAINIHFDHFNFAFHFDRQFFK